MLESSVAEPHSARQRTVRSVSKERPGYCQKRPDRSRSKSVLAFFPRRPIADRRGLPQRGKRFLYRQQGRRLERTQCPTSVDRQRGRRHRDVIGGFPQAVSIVIAERIPKAVQLAADRFDVLPGCRSAVLGVLDELRPCGGRITESGQPNGSFPW